MYSPEDGIYCHSGQTEEDAKQAINECRHGDYYRVPTKVTNRLNSALEFGEEPLVIGKRDGSPCNSVISTQMQKGNSTN